MQIHTFTTPIGKLSVLQEGESIINLYFENQSPPRCERTVTPLLQMAEVQLHEYFAGKRKAFDLPLKYAGTAFMREVWASLLSVPYAQTITYKQIASQSGSPRASRAVGNACNRNPLPVLIPCHRVVGSSGSLTGFAGGLEAKRFLLDLEKTYA